MYVLCVCEYGYILTSKTQTSFYASDILLGKLNLYILLAAGKLLNLCKPVSSSEEWKLPDMGVLWELNKAMYV